MSLGASARLRGQYVNTAEQLSALSSPGWPRVLRACENVLRNIRSYSLGRFQSLEREESRCVLHNKWVPPFITLLHIFSTSWKFARLSPGPFDVTIWRYEICVGGIGQLGRARRIC